MGWFTKISIKERIKGNKVKIPEGIWVKCELCKELIYTTELEKNANVCPKCNHHNYIGAYRRISHLIDEGTFKEFDKNLYSRDQLKFKDTKKYKDRLKTSSKKSGLKDAIVSGSGKIGGYPVQICVFDFKFMGGSMGSVVGEKIARAAERAVEKKNPMIIISCSGGARMQEGIFSLMQMAKTSSAISKLSSHKLPYISIITNPTTGGVTASFAMQGDIIIAEPEALIGFAGPRVIEQTIRQTLPEGFQRPDFLLKHGFLDMIVHRTKLKDTLTTILSYFC